MRKAMKKMKPRGAGSAFCGKSDFEKAGLPATAWRPWPWRASTLIILLFFAIFARFQLATALAVGGTYSQVVTGSEKYIDKYFQVDGQGHWQMNIYVGDQKIATVDDSGQTDWLISDHLSSVVQAIDQNGITNEINDYGPFGELRYSRSTVAQTDKFLGKELDAENKLEYLEQRYYDSGLARFVSMDPLLAKDYEKFLSDPQQLNTYSYSRNNPVTNIDENGLETKVYVEKGQGGFNWQDWLGHALLGIDGLLYNWDYNAGREHHDNNDTYAAEDMDIVTWTNFTKRPEQQSKDYDVYSFDTDKAQEREIRRFYLDLAKENGAQQGQDRFLYSIFYNGVDAVVDALKQGGVLSKSFQLGRLISRGDDLRSEMNFRYEVQQKNKDYLWKYYKTLYKNKVLKYMIDRSVFQNND